MQTEHIYPATVDGQPVHVMVSWDRTMGGFLLLVQWDEAAAEQGVSDEHALFDHWTSCTAFCKKDFAGAQVYFTQALAKLGLRPIDSVMQAVRQDSENGGPRRIVWYDENGEPINKITDASGPRRRATD